MDSFESKLDRDVARSFLHAPATAISYRPMHMTNEANQLMDVKENFWKDWISQPHPNAHPMYYDVIIDTITDYDILYPIAKQTRRYYCNSQHENEEQSIHPRYLVQRLDEHAVSINFTHDYESISNWSNSSPSIENQITRYEPVQPMKNVRFNDTTTSIPYSQAMPIPPKTSTSTDTQPSSVRYITTPFFWFRPVLDHNYAICIPTTRASLHAFLTPSFDPSRFIHLTPDPIRL